MSEAGSGPADAPRQGERGSESQSPEAGARAQGEDLPLRAALSAFVDCFNRKEFWDSHEILEGPWRATDSEFLKGLILFASAFVHVQRNNPHGIRAQLAKAERTLEAFRPSFMGFDVEEILANARTIRGRVEQATNPEAVRWDRRISLPRLRMEDPSA